MNQSRLEKELSVLPVGALRFYAKIGSTNDAALTWALQGAPDFSLIVADEQTSGRGRMERKWFTPPGSALAMSLILRPTDSERTYPARTTGLLAISLSDALYELGLDPQIKWPNDVLLNARKVAGILVETTWTGEELDAMVLGMGVNVLQASNPPASLLSFPATSIETELGRPVDRTNLLKNILENVVGWRARLGTAAFLDAWEAKLAFRGQPVRVVGASGKEVAGELAGLNPDGSLRLLDKHGKNVTVQFGEVQLRPVA